jgi:hypothetical protein
MNFTRRAAIIGPRGVPTSHRQAASMEGLGDFCKGMACLF